MKFVNKIISYDLSNTDSSLVDHKITSLMLQESTAFKFMLFWQLTILSFHCEILFFSILLRKHVFLLQGTEYYDGKAKRYVDFPITDILQMMGRAGRPQFDQHGKAVILVHEPKKSFYKKVKLKMVTVYAFNGPLFGNLE